MVVFLLRRKDALTPTGDQHDHPDYHPACAPAIDAALRRLRTDYIALFRLHGFDATTPVEETLGTLDQPVRAGKIRYIGCSNFSSWHLMKSLAVSYARGLERYVAHQAYYSLPDVAPTAIRVAKPAPGVDAWDAIELG